MFQPGARKVDNAVHRIVIFATKMEIAMTKTNRLGIKSNDTRDIKLARDKKRP